MTTRTWSSYQTAIFDFVENGTGNAVVQAVAGSGKTTTIVEALSRVNGSSIFLAFNKAIAEELKSRGVNARTFHSLTYSPVMRFKGARNVETNKLRRLVDDHVGDYDASLYGQFMLKMVGLARQAGIGCLVEDVTSEWVALADHHGIELASDEAEFDVAIQMSRQLLRWSNASKLVDFDDLLYVAVKDGVKLDKFDFIFVDEAQDTNAIQRAILRKIMHADSRVIAVGDKAQAIYGFRGSDANSLSLIQSEFGAVELPLTVSYRCPVAVVEHARQWVSHIESAPDAPAGKVTYLNDEWDHRLFQPTDLVVCRRTKPLVKLAYSLLAKQVGCRIMGKEIGEGLVNLIEKQKAKGIDALVEKLSNWASRESEKAIAKKQEEKAATINDKVEAILCLIDGLPETDRTVPALVRLIQRLFADVKGVTTLATIHKAKGLEAKRVLWLDYGYVSKWAKLDWQKEQEANLRYVATTRAQEELVLLDDRA
jgi:DNA helicase-2/ATP-dependent DNA helicase PcrA